MSPGRQNYRRDWHHQPSLPPVSGDDRAFWSQLARIRLHGWWTMSSLWRMTWPAQPSLRSRTSWASDVGTEHRDRTVSFDTWSCHLTPRIVRRHRDWKTFSLSHTVRDSVQHSQPCSTVGTMSVWKSLTRSFTGKAVLRNTFDNDVNMPRPQESFASMSAVSVRSVVISTPRYLNDPVYLTGPQSNWIACLSNSSTEHPSVIQKDFSALSVMPYSVRSSLTHWGWRRALSCFRRVYRCHQHTPTISPVCHLSGYLLEATWALGKRWYNFMNSIVCVLGNLGLDSLHQLCLCFIFCMAGERGDHCLPRRHLNPPVWDYKILLK